MATYSQLLLDAGGIIDRDRQSERREEAAG